MKKIDSISNSKTIIKALLIGAGNIGAFFDSPKAVNILSHANGYSKNAHFSLLGIVDKDYEKAKCAAEIWGCSAFESIEKAFEAYDFDVVSIAVNDAIHYEVLKTLSEKKIKLVFAEKPLTSTLEQAQEIMALYDQRCIPILMNYTRRFVPEIERLRKRIAQGEFGKFITGNGYYGKGIVHNGSHMIDLLRYLIGEVQGMKCLKAIYDLNDHEPTVSAIFEFDDDQCLTLHGVDSRLYTIFELDLLFEKKRVILSEAGSKIEYYDICKSENFKNYSFMQATSIELTSFSNGMKYAIQHIYEYLMGMAPLKATINDGYISLEIATQLMLDAKRL